jgi:energy-coupling factor transporter ATP-binding protein EcfA2/transcriptional regulator with XRE-family HTH domain
MDFTIERFKNIELVQFSTDSINLLVGGNNAGKSSVLQALQFGVSAAQTASTQGGSWNGERLSTSIGQSDLVYAPIKDVLSLASNGRLRERENEAIQITYRDGNDQCRVTVRKGRNKNILIEVVGRALGQRLQSVTEPYSALVTGLAGIPAEERFEANIVVRKAAAKGDSNSVFRNILFQLSQSSARWSNFQRQIETLFPGYSIQVSYDPDRDEVINCNVIRHATQYPIDTCGTGVLQAIQIFAYVNLFEPRLLLLDEPDSHLHPNNQKLLAGALNEVAGGGIKIVLCSHSKHIISALADSARFIWLREGRQVEDTDKYEVQALVEIGALNAGERLGNPLFVFLTDPIVAQYHRYWYGVQLYFWYASPMMNHTELLPTVRAGDNPDMSKDFWDRLQAAFKRAGLDTSQSAIARQVGIGQSAVARWASGGGYPTLDKCIKIALLTGCRVEWLLTGRGVMRGEGDDMDELTQSLLATWGQLSAQTKREILEFIEFRAAKASPPPHGPNGPSENH